MVLQREHDTPSAAFKCLLCPLVGLPLASLAAPAVQEVEEEKQEVKRRQRELRREHVAAGRERKAKEAKVQELRNRAIDVQVGKPG